jgi:hypothetical protein
MSERHTSSAGRDIDAAFNRVLAAEAEARGALARCRQEAADRVRAAEGEARAIARRAERRIQAANRIADHGIERGLVGLAAAAPRDTDGPGPEPERVSALVASLAAELTGGAP